MEDLKVCYPYFSPRKSTRQQPTKSGKQTAADCRKSITFQNYKRATFNTMIIFYVKCAAAFLGLLAGESHAFVVMCYSTFESGVGATLA